MKPVFKPKRNVPFSSKEDIEIELQRLQENGVVEKVDYSEWASPTVYVKKRKIRRFGYAPIFLQALMTV